MKGLGNIATLLAISAMMGGGIQMKSQNPNYELEPDEETIKRKGLQLFVIKGQRIWAKNETNANRKVR